MKVGAKIVEVQKRDNVRKVFGVANLAAHSDGQHFVDHDGDLIPYYVLEKAAYAFVQKSGKASEMHERMGVGTLIESFVVTPDKKKALGDVIRADAPLVWLVGFEIDDPQTVKRLDAGELREFSIAGGARTQEIAAA